MEVDDKSLYCHGNQIIPLKWRYWKTAVKEVIYLNQEKNIYSGPENQRRYFGGGGERRGSIGGTTEFKQQLVIIINSDNDKS